MPKGLKGFQKGWIPPKHALEKAANTNRLKRKGKTYEDIYGKDRAPIEREKRSKSLLLSHQLHPRKPSKETIEKIRLKNIGKKRTKEFCLRCSLLAKGRKISEQGKKNMSDARKRSLYVMPESVRKKIGLAHKGRIKSVETRYKIGKAHSGKNCTFWKGGITPKNKLIRMSIQTKLWREAVFSRDKWTCQVCEKIGGVLNAHHIKSFSKFPEIRFAIDNGITLCKKCHIEIHKSRK